MSSSGTPVNTVNGHVLTESRGVFVSGLNYKARTKEIETLFSQAGEISKCELQKDPGTGKSKGKATIQYASAASAQKAIAMFDSKSYAGMKLKVRPDTERTVISPPPSRVSKSNEPIIVNGSRVC